jgi:hypothetical protein
MELRMSNIQRYTPPTLAELTADAESAFKNDSFKQLLNQNPPEAWVKVNKYANGARYLPIDKVEYLLDKIFKRWRCEVKAQGTAFNGVWVSVRLHVHNPVTGEWDWQDGTAGEELQTKQGASPADLANINKGALAMAFPKAETEALKDAAHKFGRIFGRDLNRVDLLENKPDAPIRNRLAERTLELISEAPSMEALNGYRTNAESLELMDAWNTRADQLAVAPRQRTRKPKVNPHR